MIRQIQNYQKQGIPLSDMAILYRTNLVARSMAETLTEYNIPFTMKENIPNLYEHWISKNVLAYLRLARMIRQTGNPSQASAGSQNSFETAHTTDNARSGHSNFTVSELSEIRPLFLSVMNRPNRYLTRESLPETQDLLKAEAAVGRAASNPVLRYLALWKRAFSDKDWMIDRLEKLEYDLMQLSSLSPFAAIHYIRNVIGYDEFLKSYSEFRRISLEDLLAQLTEFQESAKPFNRLAEWEQHMKDYGEQLQRQKQTARNKNIDALALSTMHASKGLEYQVVFLPDAVEGITPYKKALKEEDMEEERRLFYVAVTRSKRFLHLCTVKTMFNKPQTPSRFLGEMRLPIEELTAGRKVIHKNYGSGTIKLVKDGRITIWFDKLGKERLLDLNFCICNQLLTLES